MKFEKEYQTLTLESHNNEQLITHLSIIEKNTEIQLKMIKDQIEYLKGRNKDIEVIRENITNAQKKSEIEYEVMLTGVSANTVDQCKTTHSVGRNVATNQQEKIPIDDRTSEILSNDSDLIRENSQDHYRTSEILRHQENHDHFPQSSGRNQLDSTKQIPDKKLTLNQKKRRYQPYRKNRKI